MGDLQVAQKEIVPIVGKLKKQQLEIEINEKLASVKGLKLRLENLKNIEQKKLEFQIDVLEKQIDHYKNQFANVEEIEHNGKIIDVVTK
jgi:hypothetical protein